MGESNKTRVMYRVNMSHSQLQFYLKFLMDKNLLQHRTTGKGRGVYGPTEEGLALLDHIEKIQSVVGNDALAA
jgi:predicted transcriptional regulator